MRATMLTKAEIDQIVDTMVRNKNKRQLLRTWLTHGNYEQHKIVRRYWGLFKRARRLEAREQRLQERIERENCILKSLGKGGWMTTMQLLSHVTLNCQRQKSQAPSRHQIARTLKRMV